ncbi:amphi-Trp domain-containing protein [Desulfovibrio oxyclinae]|uniref:amphi-Trp domain-containing protein n=1 Tax=Desulfovibrio oxyclinae TaxID=63560 RepID=UPI00035FE432|nr:amphi-Trp domain-containing protein [Desulfovibrio oxyclinae]
MEKSKVKIKQVLSREEVVTYLEDLLDGLKSGSIVVSRDDEQVALEPAERMNVEVEAKVKKDKRKFSLELSWYDDQESDVSISSEEEESGDVETVPAEAYEDALVKQEEGETPAVRDEAKTPAKSEKTPPATTSPATRSS